MWTSIDVERLGGVMGHYGVRNRPQALGAEDAGILRTWFSYPAGCQRHPNSPVAVDFGSCKDDWERLRVRAWAPVTSRVRSAAKRGRQVRGPWRRLAMPLNTRLPPWSIASTVVRPWLLEW